MPSTHPSSTRIQKHAVIWVARPLGGKDTQTNAFYKQLDMPVFHSGDALEAHAKKNSEGSIMADRHDGKLASSDIALHLTKKWTLVNLGQPLIHLNGMPRSLDQLHLLMPFLAQRGFAPKVIWFTTPEAACLKRPVRPGRELEDTPSTRAKRMLTFEEKTAPMLDVMRSDYRLSEANGNLFLIDNSDLTIEDTCRRVLNFLGLTISVRTLFPVATERALPTSEHRLLSRTSLAFA